MQSGSLTQAMDRQSIWSAPGHLWRWYVVLFVLQYFAFLGLTIWNEVAGRGGSDAVQVVLNVQRGMTASILNIAASTYIVLEGVMLAQRLREREKRNQEERIEEAREEVERQWRAWYERMQSAQEKGLPFTELPPSQNTTRRKCNAVVLFDAIAWQHAASVSQRPDN